MKKVFMTLAVALMGLTAANAQLVVGGSIGLGGEASDITKNDKVGVTEQTPARFNFSFVPRVGYMLMDGKLEVGASLLLNYDQTMENIVLYDLNKKDGTLENGKGFKDKKYSNLSFYITPYANYRIVEWKGFGVWIKGGVQLGTIVNLNTQYFAYDGYDNFMIKMERTQKDIDKKIEDQNNSKHGNFTGRFYIVPALTYDINEHWRLETSLNFLELGLGGTVDTHKYTNPITKEVTTTTTNTFDYTLGIFSGNVLNVSALTIGVAYKF